MNRVTIVVDIIPGWPNANGRIYTKEAIEGMAHAVKNNNILLYKDTVNQGLSSACGKINEVTMEKGRPTVKASMWRPTFLDHILFNDMASVQPFGKGTVKPDGTIHDYELEGFSMSVSPASPIDQSVDEDVTIICDALNDICKSAKFVTQFTAHHKGMIFADNGEHYTWVWYDSINRKLHLEPGDDGVDIHDPQEMVQLVNKLGQMYFKDA